MDVGMEAETLVPGMEHAGEAAVLYAQAFVRCQLLGQSPGGGGEKQVVGLLGARPKEQWPQLGGQGEGDHEVGSADAPVQFTRDPTSSGGAAALRTVAVIAAVPGERAPLAVIADIEVPAHHRGAAMGDGPDRALRGHCKRRRCLQVSRQELAQRADDSRAGHAGRDAGGLLSRLSLT